MAIKIARTASCALRGIVQQRALHGDVVGPLVQPCRVAVGKPGSWIGALHICVAGGAAHIDLQRSIGLPQCLALPGPPRPWVLVVRWPTTAPLGPPPWSCRTSDNLRSALDRPGHFTAGRATRPR